MSVFHWKTIALIPLFIATLASANTPHFMCPSTGGPPTVDADGECVLSGPISSTPSDALSTTTSTKDVPDTTLDAVVPDSPDILGAVSSMRSRRTLPEPSPHQTSADDAVGRGRIVLFDKMLQILVILSIVLVILICYEVFECVKALLFKWLHHRSKLSPQEEIVLIWRRHRLPLAFQDMFDPIPLHLRSDSKFQLNDTELAPMLVRKEVAQAPICDGTTWNRPVTFQRPIVN